MTFLKKIFFFSFLFLTYSLYGQQSVSKIQSQLNSIKKEIFYTDSLIKANGNNKDQVLLVVSLLSKKIESQQKLIDNTSSEIEGLKIDERKLKNRITNLSNDISKLKNEYSELIRYSFRNRDKYQILMFIFASSDFDQAYKRIKYIQNISEFQKKKVVEINNKQSIVLTNLNSLKALQVKKNNSLKLYSKQLADIELDKTKQEELILDLTQNISKLKRELNKKQKEQNNLSKALSKIIEDLRKAEMAKKMKPTEVQVELNKNFKKNKGKLPWPSTKGVLIEEFGLHSHIALKSIMVDRDGVRISVPHGTPVLSVFDGVVAKISYLPGSNMFILVKHGDYFSVYINLVDVVVKEGETVKTHQKLGDVYSGTGENSTVLEFRIKEGDNWVNPTQWLRKRIN